MDYKKKYEEVLERARQEYNTTENVERKQWLEKLFPELKESEDERIRKQIIQHIKQGKGYDLIPEGCYEPWIAWLEKQGEKEKLTHEDICKAYNIPDIGEFSDGYHTFNSLYKQRMVLFAVLVNTYKDKAWKSWKHEDGLDCFGGGWFIVGIDTPAGTYTYHYEAKDWDRFDCQILEKAKHWDGHDEFDVERLFSLVSNVNKDEVIRCLINGMKFYYEDNKEATWGTEKFSMKVNDILSWLEKQGSSSVKWQKNTPENKPPKNHSVLMKTVDGIAEGYFVGSLWFQFRWSSNIKDSDVLAWMELSDLDEQDEQKLTSDTRYEVKAGDNLIVNGKPFDYEKATITQRDFAPKDYHDIDPHFGIPVEDLMPKKNTADTTEPKFKVGDWVVNKFGDSWHIDSFDKKNYQVSDGKGNYNYFPISKQNEMHHWTIQDAKNGDVLFQDLMCGKTFIYNGVNSDTAILYSFIISNDGKDVLPYHIGKSNTGIGYIEENKNIIYPATKEQRDLLFTKMKEAGYEFDFEKKELNRLIQSVTNTSDQPTWSEEDKDMVRYIGNAITCEKSAKYLEEKGIDMIKAHRWLESLEPQPKEWSEDDEKMYKVALSCIETLEDIKNGKNRYADVKEWLKSLEDRATWKPSEEQMEIFKELIDDNNQRFFYQTLKSLYNDLKKLKGE